MASMKRWLANLSAVAASAGVSLLLTEGALRLARVHYPAFYTVNAERGYGLRAGAEGRWTREGNGQVRVNSAGFRGPEFKLAPPANGLRVAVLGDSFTEALQVDEQATWIQQLQVRLNEDPRCPLLGGHSAGAQLFNFGVGGYGTGQELLTWRHLASRYEPALVILTFYPGNDITDNDPKQRKDRPVFRLGRGGQLSIDQSFREQPATRWRLSPPGQLVESAFNHSRLLQLLNEAKNRLAAQRTSPSAMPPAGPPVTAEDSDEAWATTDALIGQLNQEVRAQGARLLVVSTSSPEQVWPRPDQRPAQPFAREQRLAGLLASRRIPYLALGPLLQRHADQQGLTLHGFSGQAPGEGHWNTEGHRLAAAAIAPWLCRQ